MTFTVRVACGDCGAVITYRDEPPPWQEDEEHKRQLEIARAFVEKHPYLDDMYHTRPALVGVNILTLKTYVKEDDVPPRFVICPSCGGRAYMGDDTNESGGSWR